MSIAEQLSVQLPQINDPSAAFGKLIDKIYEKKPYTGSSIALDSELAKEIYVKVLEYSLKKEKPVTFCGYGPCVYPGRELNPRPMV